MPTQDATAKLSPLHERHTALGAKMADFGGWTMPIEYPGGGVVREHTAVREAVGVFDVSHLGKASVTGGGAVDFLNARLANDLRRIGPGQAQYTLCCTEDGGVVDDLIAYVRSEDDVLLVPNAANTAEVVGLLAADAPQGMAVTDRHRDLGVLAVQGPRSEELLQALGLPTEHDYMSFVEAEWDARPVSVCRTGYTGEKGYELMPAWDDTPALWDALLAAAEQLGGRPAGLGARDTLRTEMGYALHGHELTPQISPVMARVGWAVGWKKDAFWGKTELERQRAEKSGPLATGLVVQGRGIPRAGNRVLRASGADGTALDGAQVGEVTSGTFSPTRRQGVALALLDRDVSEGEQVVLDVRGRAVAAEVSRPPFVEVGVRES